jgi:hypothetical protein
MRETNDSLQVRSLSLEGEDIARIRVSSTVVVCVLRVIIGGCIREPVPKLEASGPVGRVVISSCITISAVC